MMLAEPENTGPRLIGLCGAAGSGKSTVAGFLEAQGYVRLRFAHPLKAMMRALLHSAGMDEVTASRCTDGDLKERPLGELLGATPRHAMQTLGTEWGRQYIHPELWVALTMGRAERMVAEGKRVVIDDVRFPNEADRIKGVTWSDRSRTHCGELWQVCGRGGIAGTHASERHEFAPDIVLDNARCLDVLEAQVLEALLG